MKSEICNSVLRSLPLWFGIEAAIVDYVNNVQSMDTWASYEGDLLTGFISIKRHFAETAEVYVVGIKDRFHRQGIGHQLLQVVKDDLRKNNFKFLTVKTLSEARPNKEYEQTRKFYLKAGFVPLEEFKTLWDEHNPFLFMLMSI